MKSKMLQPGVYKADKDGGKFYKKFLIIAIKKQ